jgi:Tfp pilus assembly protein PilF
MLRVPVNPHIHNRLCIASVAYTATCSALRRKDWAAAAQHYEDALAINPLNHDAWFALGYAYLKTSQDHKALKVTLHWYWLSL